MRSLLIDTNAVAALFRGDERVLSALGSAERIYVSVIVPGELDAGFRGGTRYAENRLVLQRFLAKPGVEELEVGSETSECFGFVKDNLRKKGWPIPVNDIWLAAQCLEVGAVMLSFDAHFERVDGLRLWR